MTIYNIGTGVAEVTDPAIGVYLAGMSDPRQKSNGIGFYSQEEGVKSRLYARAFIVVDNESGKRVAIVSADIWTCTQVLKTKVVNELNLSKVINDKSLYQEDNVLISGTHTHSGPAGYSNNKLYDPSSAGIWNETLQAFDGRTAGFNKHTLVCICKGIVSAIENAHNNLAPGKIYINKGNTLETCGEQRSPAAFKNNIEFKRNNVISQTDREMLLLKFVALDHAGELPLGEMNWYPIHPTDLGQFNYFISGDNKGYASWLFEKEMGTDYLARDTFVAAFANSNCGDVSGNVSSGVPDKDTAKAKKDDQHMQNHGEIQFKTALSLFNSAAEELSGSVDYRHTRIDMANIKLGGEKKTWPAALGLSFAAGSSEDSVPEPDIGAFEGITTNTRVMGLSWELSDQAILARGGLALNFGSTENSPEFIKGHGRKPIVFAPGLLQPPIVPSILPIQILRIGNLVITGIPGEITTMAGRRLKQTVLDGLKGSGVEHLALATYANDYSQYITTKEEYDMQHYEGASTLFGPYTLEAYQQEFKKLAVALKNNSDVRAGPLPQAPSSNANRRITIKNNDSRKAYKIKLFKQTDIGLVFTLPDGDFTLGEKEEQAYFVPADVSKLKVSIDGTIRKENVKVDDLIVIRAGGAIDLEDVEIYKRPERIQKNKSTIGRKGPIYDRWLQPVLHMMLSEIPESFEPLLHMMTSDQPESLPSILHMMNSDQPESLPPILHMMNSDQPESLQPLLHMMNSDQPESLPSILHMMNQDHFHGVDVPGIEEHEEEIEDGQVDRESKETEDLSREPGGTLESRKERREREKREQNRREKEARGLEEKKRKARKEQREKAKRKQNQREREEEKRRKERKDQMEKAKREQNRRNQ